jgi:uncharacterized membrane protein (UPF0182 family)
MFHAPGAGATVPGVFSILRPFVPYSKDDKRPELQSFMVASSDPASYGQLSAYVVTTNVDGPAKVATNAESTDAISRELTLLNSSSGGSEVSFGDVQLVPIAGGLLYLRPLFVSVSGQAAYRKVIVSYNANAVIDDSIGGALGQLFPGFTTNIGDRTTGSGSTTSSTGTSSSGGTPTGGTSTTTPGTSGTSNSAPNSTQTPDQLLTEAQQLFDEADQALAKIPPDYATYGSKQSQARNLIAQAVKLLQGS